MANSEIYVNGQPLDSEMVSSHLADTTNAGASADSTCCDDPGCPNKGVIRPENLGTNKEINELISYNGMNEQVRNSVVNANPISDHSIDQVIYDKKATSISIVSDSSTLALGFYTHLEVEAEPAGANVPSVIWESSDPETAIVTDEGIVYAAKVGEVTITATDAFDTTITATTTITIA